MKFIVLESTCTHWGRISVNDDNDYDPDDDLDIDISPEPPVDGHGTYNEDYDPLSLVRRGIVGDVWSKTRVKILPCDHTGNGVPIRPSWDLGDGVIGADA